MRVLCDHVSKTYRTPRGEIHALRDVSLAVDEGEFVCIIGPSGCGKTTLLKLIAGLLSPSSGLVRFEGSANGGHPATALVFQQHGLFPWMSVLGNVAFGLRMRGVGRRERCDQAAVALSEVGLGAFRDRYPHELSVGMRQRVNIARALLVQPQVLLMDEPFGALDALTTLALQQELLQAWEARRCGVLYVTHNIYEAIRLGDRIVVMTGGDGGGGSVTDEIPITRSRPRDLSNERPLEARDVARRIWATLEGDVRRRLGIRT
jgi:NitT/TauT family transport system ATP-binding protein